MTLALVTGASGGIGRAIARLHARRGGDLIVTARGAAALEDLKSELETEFEVSVTCVTADLGTAEGQATVIAAAEGREVDFLVNNAGFGGHGDFLDRKLADDLAMVDLNIVAVMTLTHAIAAQMVARGKGRILNVGSTAGMMPGPMQATYFATKAFVNSFSQALDEELRARGVTVTVLAPGYVETGFAARAELDGTALSKSGQSAAQAARVGYDAMLEGKLLVTNEMQLTIMSKLIGAMPRRAVLKMVRRMQTK